MGLKSTASINEVKKAYRNMVKKNHPDVHPQEVRSFYKDKMIIINEAYHILTKTEFIQDNKKDIVVNTENNNILDNLKDPGYVYYKQGHKYFHSGFYKYYKKKSKIKNKLRATLEILTNFEKAYYYYRKVVNEYPKSQWAWDSGIKLKKIEKLTPIYKKIKEYLIENIESENEELLNIPGISILNSPEKWSNFLKSK
ncbi:MAG: DnaJ domain-containing protein [Spirochaetia bacterium]|nr:DnaJ domain-containing protein [Spirochaetia bacterium]